MGIRHRGDWSLTDSPTPGPPGFGQRFQGRRSLCLAFSDRLPSSLACALATSGHGSDGRDGFMGLDPMVKGGGNSNVFYVHPDPWGHDPI